MNKKFLTGLLTIFFINLNSYGQDDKNQKQQYFHPIERSHTIQERFKHVSILYGISWPAYIFTQYKTVQNNGS